MKILDIYNKHFKINIYKVDTKIILTRKKLIIKEMNLKSEIEEERKPDFKKKSTKMLSSFLDYISQARLFYPYVKKTLFLTFNEIKPVK